jgi:hypothetical protein
MMNFSDIYSCSYELTVVIAILKLINYIAC